MNDPAAIDVSALDSSAVTLGSPRREEHAHREPFTVRADVSPQGVAPVSSPLRAAA